MNEQLQEILSDLRVALKGHYGNRLVKLVLFGSRARGDAEEDSDIDLLVVLNGDVDPAREVRETIDIVTRISLDHDVVCSTLFVGEAEYLRRESPFLMNVRREGLTI
jgi:predicted nucleotidyltransferase